MPETPQTCAILVLMRLDFLSPHSDDYPLWSLILITAWLVNWLRAWVMLREFLQGAVPPSCN